MIVAVAPFATEGLDPDALDLARFCAAETAVELDLAGAEVLLLLDEVPLDVPADVTLRGSLRLAGDRVEVDALLVDAAGVERARFHESLSLGAAPRVGRVLARAVLLALGDDAAAPPEIVEAEAPSEAVLRLARAARKLQDGEVEEAAQDLLALCAGHPSLAAARRTLLAAVQAGQGGAWMPALHAALEQLVEVRPDDCDALLLLAQIRAAHLDEASARELFSRARRAAPDALSEAEALKGLADLASSAGRTDEAVAHLRAAVKLVDDAQLYARLAAVLRDPDEVAAALTRATVLAPDDPTLHLALARALRDRDPGRALAAATEALRLRDSAEARAEIASLLQEPR